MSQRSSSSNFSVFGNPNDKSSVWSHFLRSNCKQLAECKLCKGHLKVTGGSTHSLHTHLKSKHNITLLKRSAGGNIYNHIGQFTSDSNYTKLISVFSLFNRNFIKFKEGQYSLPLFYEGRLIGNKNCQNGLQGWNPVLKVRHIPRSSGIVGSQRF